MNLPESEIYLTESHVNSSQDIRSSKALHSQYAGLANINYWRIL